MESVGTAQFAADLNACDRAMLALQKDLQAGVITYDHFEAETDQVIAKMDLLRASTARAATATSSVSTAMIQQGKAVKGAGMDIGNAAFQASRAIEDLQYGLGGVINNIPGVVMALGGGAGLTATIALASIGINQLVNHYSDLTRAFSSTVTIPKVTGDLSAMSKELEAAKDRMEKLAKQTRVTLDEFEEWNTLRAKTAELETKIAEERERQARVKEFEGLKDVRQTEEEKARAESLKPNFGDPENKNLIQSIAKSLPPNPERVALQETLKKRLKAVDDAIEAEIAGRGESGLIGEQNKAFRRSTVDSRKREADQAQAEIVAFDKNHRGDAAQLASDAVTGGKLDALRKIQDLMQKNPSAFSDKQREAFERASPEGMLAAKAFQEKIDASAIQAQEDQAARTAQTAKDNADRLGKAMRKALAPGVGGQAFQVPGGGEPAAGGGGAGVGPGMLLGGGAGGGAVVPVPIAGAAAAGVDASAQLPKPVDMMGKSTKGMNRVQRAKLRREMAKTKRKAVLAAQKQAKAQRQARLNAANAKREAARLNALNARQKERASSPGPPKDDFFLSRGGQRDVTPRTIAEGLSEVPKIAVQGAQAARGAAAITVKSLAVVEATHSAMNETQEALGNALGRLARVERNVMHLQSDGRKLVKAAVPPTPSNLAAGG